MTHTAMMTCASAGVGMEFARQIAAQGIAIGATLGAGATITKDAPDHKLTLERSIQLTLKCSKRPVPQPKRWAC